MIEQTPQAITNGAVYRRILLKISGEALMGEQNYGIDVNVARTVAEELKAVRDLGVELAAAIRRRVRYATIRIVAYALVIAGPPEKLIQVMTVLSAALPWTCSHATIRASCSLHTPLVTTS